MNFGICRTIQRHISFPKLIPQNHILGLQISSYPRRHLRTNPAINAITKKATNRKNRNLAIEAAPAAIPPKPNTAAMIAMIKKINAQRNIVLNFSGTYIWLLKLEKSGQATCYCFILLIINGL